MRLGSLGRMDFARGMVGVCLSLTTTSCVIAQQSFHAISPPSIEAVGSSAGGYFLAPSPSDAVLGGYLIDSPGEVTSPKGSATADQEGSITPSTAQVANGLSELAELQANFDKRLKELEEGFEERVKAEKDAKAAAKKKPTIKIGGRIHADYWGFPYNEPGIGFLEHPNPGLDNFGNDPEDRFVFRRIRLELQGDIPENMLWRMQVDFNNPALPEYKDVYFGWEELPGNHTLLLGNQKRPLGLDHLNSSRYNVFMERPLVVEAFNEDARRVGVCMYGANDDESLNWRYGIFNLENSATTGRIVGDSLQMGGYARLAGSPWYDEAADGRGYFHWGLAGAVSNPDGNSTGDTNQNEGRFRTRAEGRSDARWLDTGRIPGANWYEILAAESMLNIGRFQFTSEYMVSFLQRDDTFPNSGQDLFFHGFYLYGSYFLTGEHMAYDRASGTLDRVKPFENFFLVDRMSGGTGRGWGAWQVAARYDYLDLTDQDIRGGTGQNFTLGLNWYWNAYSKMQTNLIYGDIKDHRLVNGFDGGNFSIIGTRFMCDF